MYAFALSLRARSYYLHHCSSDIDGPTSVTDREVLDTPHLRELMVAYTREIVSVDQWR